MAGSAVSILHHDNQHKWMDIVPYLIQELHLENTTCVMNEEIYVQPIVQENTKVGYAHTYNATLESNKCNTHTQN
jgi:hypothetical protein